MVPVPSMYLAFESISVIVIRGITPAPACRRLPFESKRRPGDDADHGPVLP